MKYITTRKQFMYIFGERQAYLRRLKEIKERKMMASLFREEEEAKRIEEEAFKKELQKKRNWRGQLSADLQYDGHELSHFKYLLQGK